MNLYLKHFLDITLKNEFNISNEKNASIRKWNNNIIIYTSFDKYNKELDMELDRIIKEINNLSQSIKIFRQLGKRGSNLQIYFTNKEKYKKILPESERSLVDSNFGLGTLFTNNNKEIKKALIYVDIEREKNIQCQKHLLREELTQSLGMTNDIEMNNSIFNQKYQCTTEYTLFDRMIIFFFLSKEIKPGMKKKEIIEAFNSSNFL